VEICLVSPSLVSSPPLFGGAIETFTYELGVALSKLKNSVSIITRKGLSQDTERKADLRIIALKIPNHKLMRGAFYNFKIFKQISKLRRFDIFHTQGTSVFPSVSLISKILKTPVIHTEHVYHPWLQAAHASLHKRIKYPLEFFLGKVTLMHVQKIIVANKLMRKILLQTNPRLLDKIEVIPQGINPSVFNCDFDRGVIRERLGISRSDRIILYVGRLAREKNIDQLIQAFIELKRQYDDLKLLLVGPKGSRFPVGFSTKSSQYALGLEEWVRKKDLGNSIIFTGPIPYTQITEYYASCDLLVQPSSFETFGRVILEAAAMGIPYICRQIGEYIPSYFPKKSALFLKQINVNALKNSIEEILNNATEFRKNALLEANKTHALYNWIEIAKRYLNQYKEIRKN
jgi:1,2-diacylglycerol 3-alpha-glucosyltransferase